MEQFQSPRSVRPAAIAAGIILLVVGGGMLFDTRGVLSLRLSALIAPLVLISIGVGSMLNDDPSKKKKSTSGLWMIGLGAWMMASQTHLFGLTFGTSWPFLLIFGGFLMMIRGMR